jgi:MFS family permease
MSAPISPFSEAESRRVWRGAYWNGILWAFGNGLVSSTLITYFAKDLGAASISISWIVAFPQLFGLFRLIAPWLLDWNPNRKRMAMLAFLLSGVLLLQIPLVVQRSGLLSLVLLWGGWHFFMYVALIPFYSWLGDAGASDDRVRRLGWREMGMLLATIAGNLTTAAIVFVQVPPATTGTPLPPGVYTSAYCDCLVLGALCILISVIPLWGMPHYERNTNQAPVAARELWALLYDKRYWPLLAFNMCFSFANGITAAAVAMYPYRILGMSVVWLLVLQTYHRAMQAIASPIASGWLSWAGHRWPLMLSQWLVSLGLVFYMFTDASNPNLLYGAWTCWIAYIVLNIGLPNLMLKLSPGESSPTYVAVTMAVSGVAFATASLLGGWLLGELSGDGLSVPSYVSTTAIFLGMSNNVKRDPFLTMFALGCILRLLTSIWLYFLSEPPSATACK